jgi:hypothetical protein
MTTKILVTPQEKAMVDRSYHLHMVTQQEGWPIVVRISLAIVEEALKALEAYAGTSVQEHANLAFIWKASKAHHEKLLLSIQAHIDEGESFMLRRTMPKTDQTETESAISFPVVKPACDVDPEPEEPTEP